MATSVASQLAKLRKEREALEKRESIGGTAGEARDHARAAHFDAPHLLGVGAGQHLGAGAEAVGADGEHRVLAGLVLAELGADAREQHGKAERLGDVVVGAQRQSLDAVVGQFDPLDGGAAASALGSV